MNRCQRCACWIPTATSRATCPPAVSAKHPGWACYHTDMWVVDVDGTPVGVVGTAVGASFAVLIAEQLAVSGAELIISITSAGNLRPGPRSSSYVLVARALRDEGTSLHYQLASTWAAIDANLLERLRPLVATHPEPVVIGASWTTDAPYRETQVAIDTAAQLGAICVEMEAAALYSFAANSACAILCFAHLTNTMAVAGDDFEKGEANGAHAALDLVRSVLKTLGTGQKGLGLFG
jgi:uridine phosphorylase